MSQRHVAIQSHPSGSPLTPPPSLRRHAVAGCNCSPTRLLSRFHVVIPSGGWAGIPAAYPLLLFIALLPSPLPCRGCRWGFHVDRTRLPWYSSMMEPGPGGRGISSRIMYNSLRRLPISLAMSSASSAALYACWYPLDSAWTDSRQDVDPELVFAVECHGRFK